MNDLKEKAKLFLDLVLSSSNAVAMTGAGISTESGIPDYRSPGTGLWEKMDQSVVSLDGFIEKPSRYYDYSLELYPVRKSAKPNAGHDLLAELENRDILKGIITQNVDGLHQDAGSGEVHELHGSLRQAVCIDCNVLQSMDEASRAELMLLFPQLALFAAPQPARYIPSKKRQRKLVTRHLNNNKPLLDERR